MARSLASDARAARAGRLLALVACGTLVGGGALHAQIPDTFTNLQVLPKEISKLDLVTTMRSYASSLGVRCVHCHATKAGVDPTSDDLADVDFASDAREAKLKARDMVKMVRAINNDYLAKLTGGSMIEVRCATCHRGVAEPELIDQRVERLMGESGVATAVADYRALRPEFLTSGSYNFGSGPLNALGEKLLRNGKPADAKALLALNAEFNPDADWTQFLLGEALLANGEKDAAKVAFARCLEIDADNPRAKKRLDELNGVKAPEEPKPEPPKPPEGQKPPR